MQSGIVQPEEMVVDYRSPARNLSPYVITDGHGHCVTSQS